jgi:HEAT repeat protein
MKKLWWFACCLVALAGCNNKPDPVDSENYLIEGRSISSWLNQIREDPDDLGSVQEVFEVLQTNMGPDDKEAVPALVAALQDENAKVRWIAVKCLGQIEPAGKEVELAVAKAMEDKDERVSRAAIVASGKIVRASLKTLLGNKDEAAKDSAPKDSAPKNGNGQ